MIKVLFSDSNDMEIKGPSIFLAGPTSRENDFQKSWRKEMIECLEKVGFAGTVCVPEFGNMRPFQPEDWEAQVAWEEKFLTTVDVILFWVPRKSPDMLGLTTNLEFGTYFTEEPRRVILAYPLDAESMQWMELRYRSHKFEEPIHDMQEAAEAACHLAKERFIQSIIRK